MERRTYRRGLGLAVSDRQELERFAARQQQDWKIPPVFRWLNLMAIAALAACVGIPVAGAIRRSSRRRRP